MIAFFFFLSVALSWCLTKIVIHLAFRYRVLDIPSSHEKKLHKNPIPLLGGVAIWSAFALMTLIAVFFDFFTFQTILLKHLIGLMLASLWVVFWGVMDEIYDLKPSLQILGTFPAIFIIIASGIGITLLSHPLGIGFIELDQYTVTIFQNATIHWKLTLPSDLFTLVWIMGMMYTTKILDGLDGLVTGIGSIALLMISALAFFAQPVQHDVAFLSMIVLGVFCGFLLWNFYPAKIFLGNSGSLLIGFFLGVFSIISEAKVTITFLILGVYIFDLAWVIFSRLFIQKKSIASGDTSHLHHKFLKIGLTHRQAVLLMYGISFFMGILGLLFQGRLIMYAFGGLTVLVILMAFLLRDRKLSSFAGHTRGDRAA